MPDMTGRPRGVCRPVANSIFHKGVSVEADVSKPMSGNSAWGQQEKGFRDITDQNEDEELQKAIALSLQGDTTVEPTNSLLVKRKSMDKIEEDDLARALAESIAEIEGRQRNRASLDYNHVSLDPADPHRLLRKDRNWPVGLQNVGNTCWFNVVVQSLFHIPYFRSLVLKFSSTLTNCSLPKETQRNLQLVHELRCLFALMVASKRCYVDPAKSVNIFQESFLVKSSNSQQDVSEFIHMLLDQLEEAFRYDQEVQRKNERHGSSSDHLLESAEDMDDLSSLLLPPLKHATNPMLELFYGTSKTIGVNNGNAFEQEHSFGILPLCVKGRKTLHASLDYATAIGTHDSSSGSGHEVWFTKLPPVLTFQLSRFHFNQSLGKPEKIHDRLSFPSVLYMDRYMEANMQITRDKREEVRKLRLQLNEHKSRLCRFLNYPNNGNLYCLTDILSCCAEYACEKSTSQCNVEPVSPLLRQSRRRLGSGSPSDGLSPIKRCKDDDNHAADAALSWPSRPTSAEPPASPLDGSELSLASSLENEAQLVESILRKWKINTERQITDLKEKICEAELVIDRIFEEPSLHSHPYSLHTVLVHQGQAMAGHYWAYIRDHANQRWLKFNDVAVTEATFEQLNCDSVGGAHSMHYYGNSTSAYCLVYVDSRRTDLFRDTVSINEIAADTMLAKFVKEHNQQFENEIEKWNLHQATKMSLAGYGSDIRDNDEKAMEQSSAWNLSDMKNVIDRVGDTYQGMGADKALEEKTEENSADKTNASNKKLYSDVVNSSNKPDDPVLNQDKKTACLLDEEEGVICPIMQASILAIMKVGKTYNLDGPDAALLEAIDDEMKRLKSLSKKSESVTTDSRLLSIVVYLYQNNAPRKLIERCVLEQFTDNRLKYDRRSSDIMRCASSKLNNLSPEDLGETDYRMWKARYHSFCTATSHLIEGVDSFASRRFFQAVQHFVSIHDHNNHLVANGELRQGVDSRLVSRYCRTCIQRVHDEAVQMMQSQNRDVATDGLEMMRKKLIPCISILLSSSKGGGSKADLQLADTIRDDWCSLIEQTIVIPREELSDALTEFLDANPLCAQSISTPLAEKPVDLFQRYERVMTSLLQPPA